MSIRHRWPRKMVIQELFINDDGRRDHVHVAACDRKKLIRLAHIAQHHYNAGDPEAVRDFPPFDTVDNVHTDGSFHYRQGGQCSVPRNYENRGNGLAFDLRSAQARREAFAHEVKRRYGAKESDF